jgi:hypothetical protein
MNTNTINELVGEFIETFDELYSLDKVRIYNYFMKWTPYN